MLRGTRQSVWRLADTPTRNDFFMPRSLSPKVDTLGPFYAKFEVALRSWASQNDHKHLYAQKSEIIFLLFKWLEKIQRLDEIRA